ncbi:uncharacterized protein METZ01_LOCUS448145, partial [marine metagenome]
SGGAATLSSATPTSISASGNVYTLGIGLSGIANGSETITVVPVDNGIYDGAGNESSTSQSNNTASLAAIGESLSFDGNDYITLSSGINSSNATGSIGLWVKLTDIYVENIIFQAGAKLMMTFHETKGLVFGMNTSNQRKELDISITESDYLNTWKHIVGVYDGTNMKLYVDGAQIGSTTLTGNVSLSSSEALHFGRNADNNTDGFNGYLDEVAYWDDALTAAEVTALYNSGIALDAKSNSGNYASSEDLIGYWKMEE